ncbi:hypothetical protein GCM10009745_70590 [Kribbella yunnanensis]|uniref:Uncharacterized protein n=1 Tax=Kribbella yunnanensis TaxID=190194 RepID=A0ABP4UUM7_9ACTN
MQTFVVRVWSPADGPPGDELRGIVQHIATGQSIPFRTRLELIHVIRTCMTDRTPPAT